MIHLLPILQIFDSNLDILQGVKDIHLGESNGSVAIDSGRVSEQRDVKPTTATGATSCHSEFVTSFLQKFTNFLRLKIHDYRLGKTVGVQKYIPAS